MKNIEKIARIILDKKPKNLLIHTIPNTPHWMLCERIEQDKWLLTICNPERNVIHELGIVNTENHLKIWEGLIKMELETKMIHLIARKQKQFIRNFINGRNYQNLIKNRTYAKRDKKHKKI